MIINHPLLGPRDAQEFTYLGDASLIDRPDWQADDAGVRIGGGGGAGGDHTGGGVRGSAGGDCDWRGGGVDLLLGAEAEVPLRLRRLVGRDRGARGGFDHRAVAGGGAG